MENLNESKEQKETVTGGCPFHSNGHSTNESANERLTLNTIPEKFMEWLVSSRVQFLDNVVRKQQMQFFSAHLPTMITWEKDGQFPVNMTTKGIGLIPKTKYLHSYTELFEETANEAIAADWDASLSERTGANMQLYNDIEHFNSSLLGGLEIFEGKAMENLRENPVASLLYVGMSQSSDGMEYISFQVNGEVEILDKNHPYYRFLLSSRKLFEFDKFHLYQPDYPFGYIIKVKEVRNKSPFTRTNNR